MVVSSINNTTIGCAQNKVLTSKLKLYIILYMQKEREAKMRIRLNQEYRNKIANRMRVHLEQEDTHEKQVYDSLKGDQIDLNDNAWNMAKTIVRRHYTKDDVAKA